MEIIECLDARHTKEPRNFVSLKIDMYQKTMYMAETTTLMRNAPKVLFRSSVVGIWTKSLRVRVVNAR